MGSSSLISSSADYSALPTYGEFNSVLRAARNKGPPAHARRAYRGRDDVRALPCTFDTTIAHLGNNVNGVAATIVVSSRFSFALDANVHSELANLVPPANGLNQVHLNVSVKGLGEDGLDPPALGAGAGAGEGGAGVGVGALAAPCEQPHVISR